MEWGEKYQKRGKWVSFDGEIVGWSGGGESMHWGVSKGLVEVGRGDKKGWVVDIAFQEQFSRL